MKLINFLNDLFKDDGFILIDYNSNKYVIGKPLKKIPIELQLLDKSFKGGIKFLKSESSLLINVCRPEMRLYLSNILLTIQSFSFDV